MTDEAFAYRLRGAMIGGFRQAELSEGYNDLDWLGKWKRAAEFTMQVLGTNDRAALEDAFNTGRIPGFREANDEIWKATGGKVFTVEVDNDTRFITRAYLAEQPGREVV